MVGSISFEKQMAETDNNFFFTLPDFYNWLQPHLPEGALQHRCDCRILHWHDMAHNYFMAHESDTDKSDLKTELKNFIFCK